MTSTSAASKAPADNMTTQSNAEGSPSTSSSEGELSPEKASSIAADNIALSVHTKRKRSTSASLYNPPKNTKLGEGFQPAKKAPFRAQQYNCKFWVNKGYCNTRNTTCKWRHDEERRNVWPWIGNQDEVFPDLIGVYSE